MSLVILCAEPIRSELERTVRRGRGLPPRATSRLPPGLEENRWFAGVGFKPAAWMAAELGYMNRLIPETTNPAGAQMQHTALLTLSFSPDLRLKPKPVPSEALLQRNEPVTKLPYDVKELAKPGE